MALPLRSTVSIMAVDGNNYGDFAHPSNVSVSADNLSNRINFKVPKAVANAFI